MNNANPKFPAFAFDKARFCEQLRVMTRMQNSANVKMAGPDWRTKNIPYHRAISVEAVEYMEHLGTWKWWKKGKPDFAQAEMELIDIWHFALSLLMVESTHEPGSVELADEIASTAHCIIPDVNRKIAQVNSDELETEAAASEARHAGVDALLAVSGNRSFSMSAFFTLLALTNLSQDELFLRYVGKNTLNHFRQDNGDKQGTYVKVWAGKEDNVYLHDILMELRESPAQELPALVYAQLQAKYTALAGAAA